MSNLYFEPWVGENYSNCTGEFKKRILILGKSNYQWDADITPPFSQEFSSECIEEHISVGNNRFRTKVINVFQNKTEERSLEERKAFWHSVAFTNFIQESVGLGPGAQPTADMWKEGAAAFPELLEKIQPHFIAVLGFELWENLPDSKHQGPDITNVEQDSKTTYFHSHSGGKALAFRMKHPSRGFAYDDWVPGLKEAISKAPSD